MIIYFLRHGSAGQPNLDSKRDEKRPLDEAGERQSHDVGRALARLKVDVDVIISSPLTRALQTAEIAAQEMGHKSRIVTDDGLRPEASYDAFQDLLARNAKHGAILVAGHNPSMTDFLIHILAGATAPDFVDFKKGAVAKVETDGSKAVLSWMLTPKLARVLQEDSARSSRAKTLRK